MKKYTYVLRNCKADMTSHGGFVWPKKGKVECHDWDPKKECGNGLHGWLMGAGDPSLGYKEPDAVWLVVRVEESEIVDLGGKVKFPRGNVVYCGTRDGATSYIIKRGATSCNWGTATAGYSGTATAGGRGTATAGDGGTATAGDWGTATAGDYGTATAGRMGTATAGDCGTATAGYRGTATAGDCGAISIRYYCKKYKCYRLKVSEVGHVGLEPNVEYYVTESGEWAKK